MLSGVFVDLVAYLFPSLVFYQLLSPFSVELSALMELFYQFLQSPTGVGPNMLYNAALVLVWRGRIVTSFSGGTIL